MSGPWQMEAGELARQLAVDPEKGLTSVEARSRLQKYGPNLLKEKAAANPWLILAEQFNDFIIWVLMAAALVSGFMREWVDALAIIAIVVINAVLGFIQEYKAERSLAALRSLATPSSKVYRDGVLQVIPSPELVPGDCIELEEGAHVPADSRLVWATSSFSTNEASLTGESTPVVKTSLLLSGQDVPLADRANMAYTGTSVAAGRAKAVVIATGMETELGKIAGMIQSIHRETTPLQKKLEDFGKWIVYVCFVLVGLVFALELVRGGRMLDVFLTSVSLAVAAIPEGLPAVVTIALALGVQRMVKRHALIRKLPSVETLGGTTVICSDKTGTLTKNEMTVRQVYAGGRLFKVTGTGYDPAGGEFIPQPGERAGKPSEFPGLEKALLTGVLCNSAQLVKDEKGYRVVGDPTEAALLTAAAKANIWKKESEWDFAFFEEIPFDAVRKKMTVVRRDASGSLFAFVKGAPDMLLTFCAKIEEDGQPRELTRGDREKIMETNARLADQALRVLAFAYRKLDKPPDSYEAAQVEQGLVFLGLAAMIDPPRDEVKEALADCSSAGIRTVMVTGDHKNTAVAIATELGLFRPGDMAVSGEELDALSDDEFTSRLERTSVYARVSPAHKLKIVRAWRARGDVVAVTGDGVNDAPAVKEADIGVAMGIAGTDVTREVSDMVITDDNFASIVAAVEEGRGIYDNIKKFIHYLLSCNTGEILVMFVASLAGMPVPLLPIQILWVNLVTDGLPALALGMDPVDKNIMRRPPRALGENIITGERLRLIVSQGVFIAFCSLFAFWYVFSVEKEGLASARSAAFIVLCCTQLFHALNCRSQEQSFFKLGIFTNPQLICADLISFGLVMLVVYVPFLQVVFKTEPLGMSDWFLVIGLSSLPLWAMELVKLVRKR